MSDAPSLRETIESAMSASAEAAPEAVEAPVEAVEAAPGVPEVAPQETAAEAAQRVRDEAGRFARADKKAAAKPAEAKAADPAKPAPVAEAKPAAVPDTKPEPAAPPVKAPQSWKPQAREAFAKAPPEVQQEVMRRETEIARALNETAQARQTAEAVQRTLAPYETIARANGMDSMQYAGSVLQTAAVLHMGSQQQKDALIAQLIGMYGASVDGINAHLQGQAPQAHAAPQPPPDVSRLVQQEFQRVAQEAQQQRATSAWEEFQSSAPEFLEDVKGDMREILELAGRQGRNMTYQQAYDRACKLNEDVASILAARKSTEAARAQAPTVARAKAAGSSIKATPAATAIRPAGPRSLRETIEEAVAAQRT